MRIPVAVRRRRASFLSLATDMPRGAWIRGESPDYILSSDRRRYGLEITTLVLDSAGGSVPLAAIRRSQDSALQSALQSAGVEGLPPLQVRVMFRDNDVPLDEHAASYELLGFVRGAYLRIDDSKTWAFNTPELRYIERVHIHRGTHLGRPWLHRHRWSRLHINWVRVDPVAELQRTIERKAESHRRYLARCDECWLLIGVDEWTAPEAVAVTERALCHTYMSPFTRLYFPRNVEGSLHQLLCASCAETGG